MLGDGIRGCPVGTAVGPHAGDTSAVTIELLVATGGVFLVLRWCFLFLEWVTENKRSSSSGNCVSAEVSVDEDGTTAEVLMVGGAGTEITEALDLAVTMVGAAGIAETAAAATAAAALPAGTIIA